MVVPSSSAKHFTAFSSALEENSASKTKIAGMDESGIAAPFVAPALCSPSTTVVKAANICTRPTYRSAAAQGYGSAEVQNLGGDSEGQNTRYCIRFYNEIPDSSGTANHACQRELQVETSEAEDAAISLAIMEFEKLEKTSSWTTHARSIECTVLRDAS